MGKLKKLIVTSLICTAFSTALIFGFIYLRNHTITFKISGEDSINLNLNDEYVELGCAAYFGNMPIDNISVSGSVDTATPGVYQITYTAKRHGKEKTTVRTVRVKDNVAPVITAPSEIELLIGKNVTDAVFTYSATDNYDGDITSRIIADFQNDKIVLKVTDSSGNKTVSKIAIKRIADNVAPVIALNGESVIFMRITDNYQDLGFCATDNIDGDVTKKVLISGDDELFETGNHIITYTVTDTSGNTATAERTVVVYDPDADISNLGENSKIIYLTFDDGPCVYTPQVLNVLSTYGVKATFFVTNQKPDYQKYISEAYNRGHAIGAHTYSHVYSIYQSTEAYFADLKAICDVIYNQTGIYTRLLRFPGGSSNTISRKYAKGIMTTLTNEVTQKGYVYFDWNVVSGDADSTPKKNDPNYIIANVTTNLKNGANIVLMHDMNPANITALPVIIEYALSNGYTFLPLDETSPTAHHTVLN